VMAAQQASVLAEADEVLREAEKLMTPPSTRLGRLLWRADPVAAAPKYQSAANKFAYCRALDLAKRSFERAAESYAASGQDYAAGQNFEKAFGVSDDGSFAAKAADAYRSAGQPALAAETLCRCGQKAEDPALVAAAVDDAELAGGQRAVDVARSCFVWLAGRRYASATPAAATLLAMMDVVGVEATEPSRARIVADLVVLRLLESLDDAERVFLDALPEFAPADEARFVDDLIAACKQRDRAALKAALCPANLALLDMDVANIARTILADPVSALASWWRVDDADDDPAPPPRAEEEEEDDESGDPGDDDDLPDIA